MRSDNIGAYIDVTGMRFGSLTVLKRCGAARNGSILWLCKCDCGKFNEVRSDLLRNGHTKSCGKCPVNSYTFKGDIVIGKTAKGEKFIFDNEFLQIVKQYSWYMDDRRCVKTNLKDNKILRLHSLIMGNKNGFQIDHINHDPSDNRKKNLREVTQQQNIFNNSIRADNKTGFKGVYFNNSINKYQASVVLNGRSHYLGVYDSPKEAAKAYNQKAIILFGEYAFLNSV